jgi:hypothetical protein
MMASIERPASSCVLIFCSSASSAADFTSVAEATFVLAVEADEADAAVFFAVSVAIAEPRLPLKRPSVRPVAVEADASVESADPMWIGVACVRVLPPLSTVYRTVAAGT